jgi:hypothetical protein
VDEVAQSEKKLAEAVDAARDNARNWSEIAALARARVGAPVVVVRPRNPWLHPW